MVNIIGATLFLTYVIIYWMFTINKNSTLRQFSCALMILFASIFYTQIYELDSSVALESMGEK